MSPDLTSSPSLTSHLASVPSSIVGERAGILSSMGIVAVVPVTWGGGACRYGFPPRHKHSPGQGPAGELAFPTNVTQSRARKRHEGSGLVRTYLVVVDDSQAAALAWRFGEIGRAQA